MDPRLRLGKDAGTRFPNNWTLLVAKPQGTGAARWATMAGRWPASLPPTSTSGIATIARYEPDRAQAAGVDLLAGSADDETQARVDTFLIDRWNEVVGPEDEGWLLGDVVMGQLDRTITHLGRLLGHVVLVPGNHDRVWAGDRRRDEWWDRYLAAGIDRIVDGTAVLELADGTVVDVDHFPYRGDSGTTDRYVDWRPEDRGRVLLHGHVHSTWRTNGRMINVSVDVWDYAPIGEAQVIDLVSAASEG